ncbi:hypothetical protein GCM10011349_20190 [Novosphingobium indicum]|uniref:Uncharacterized protein n=1 Tax=Novosphingobium indicum TaxID=462949 RepID=A0ABQ2JNN8_9SPHN|nr:hypothetical protein [Novosphingobium indicum]GGN49503.1 hypothetical protein GCM10011349_20190 [Novosphingobium indicum]
MLTDDQDHLRKALTAAEPTLERHEEIVACAERRVRRASERLDRAQTELAEAAEALITAREARTEWIANNPDPQLMML